MAACTSRKSADRLRRFVARLEFLGNWGKFVVCAQGERIKVGQQDIFFCLFALSHGTPCQRSTCMCHP